MLSKELMTISYTLSFHHALGETKGVQVHVSTSTQPYSVTVHRFLYVVLVQGTVSMVVERESVTWNLEQVNKKQKL